MYSKYKEIKVILEILLQYKELLFERYFYSANLLQELISETALETKSFPTPDKVKIHISAMNHYSNEYEELGKLIRDISDIIFLYEHSFKKDNLKNMLPLKTDKDIVKKFTKIEQSDHYSKTLSEIAYDQWLSADEFLLENLNENYQDNLNELYNLEEIEQRELIYYTLMIKYLFQHPEYKEEKGYERTL